MKPLTGTELCEILRSNGWTLVRVSGSHHIFRKEGRRETLSVPVHGSKTLKSGTQRTILKHAKIDTV